MLPALEPIELHSLADRAADRLRDSLIRGILKPGDRLVERAIADQLGVSKTAVREALIRLEQEGLVQRWRNKETRVTLLTPKQVREANRIRRVLEPLALADAHEFLTKEDVKKAQELIRKMDEAGRKRDYPSYVALDLEFHRHFWQLSGDETLLKLLVNTCTPLFAYLMMEMPNMPDDSYLKDNSIRHFELLESVEGGNPKKIRSVLQCHIKSAWYPETSSK